MINLFDLITNNKKFILLTIFPTFFLKLISSLGVILFNITILFLSDKNTLGLFTIGLSILTFSSIISRIGLNSAILRFTSISIYEKKDVQFKNEIIFSFIFSLLLSFIIFTILISFENFIAYKIYQEEQLRKVIILIALNIPLYSIILIQKSLFNSFKISQLSSISDLGAVLLITSLIAIFVEFFFGINLTIYRLCIYFLISSLILILFLGIMLINLIISKFVLVFESSSFKVNKLFVKSLPNYFLIDLSNYFLVWGTIFLASFFLTPSDLAVFSTIFLLGLSLNFVPITLNSIFSPIFSVKYKKDDIKGLIRTISNYKNISILINLPIISLSLFFSEEILNYLFKTAYEFDILIFRIIILTHSIKVFSGPLILLYNLIGKEVLVRNISLLTLITHLSLICILAYYFSNAALAISVSFFVTLMIKYIILNFSYIKFKKLNK